jgi:hypothetical protein
MDNLNKEKSNENTENSLGIPKGLVTKMRNKIYLSKIEAHAASVKEAEAQEEVQNLGVSSK